MMTSESSFTGDEEQLKEATTVPKMINTKIDEFPGLDSVDFELVDQSDLERDITLQAAQALFEKENELDNKRLTKAQNEREKLHYQIARLLDKLENRRTKAEEKTNVQKQVKELEEKLGDLDKEVGDINDRLKDREASTHDTLPLDASVRMPNESQREYLIRTGKITPFAKLPDDVENEEGLPNQDTGAPLGVMSHQHLRMPGFLSQLEGEPEASSSTRSVKRRRLIQTPQGENYSDAGDGVDGLPDTTDVELSNPSDDYGDGMSSEGSKPKARKRKTKDAPTKKEDLSSMDDGNEKQYRSRLNKWVSRRREARDNERANISELEVKVEESIDDPGEEWNMPHPSIPDLPIDGQSSFNLPGDIHPSLFDYQRTCVQWLWELHKKRVGGIIGDEMGLGKTIQLISFIAGLHYSKHLDKPVIVVAPATVLKQWVDEFHKWWPPLRVAILHSSGSGMLDLKAEEDYEESIEDLLGYKPTKKKAHSGAEKIVSTVFKHGHVLVTTYAGLQSYGGLLLSKEWAYAVLDEGHKIRNPNSGISLACKQLKTPHRIILSGTPMQNNLKELWSLFDFIYPGRLGTLPVFQQAFEIPIKIGGYANATNIQIQTAYQCACVLREQIGPYLLQRMKADVAKDLPKKVEQILFCKLTKIQRDAYEEYLKSSDLKAIMDGKRQILVGVDMLRKICNHPDLMDKSLKQKEGYIYGKAVKSGKMQVVKALLELWKKEGHRTLLFSQTRQMLDILETFVRGLGTYNYRRMDGNTQISNRQSSVNEFNNNRDIDLFLLTTKVGGLGVNLTGADRVIIFDPDWNPSTDAQARERAWRLGQTREVTIYRLVTAGTIEEKMYHRQIYKQFLTNKILKDPKQRRFFKMNDLQDLFTLGSSNTSSTETGNLFRGAEKSLGVGSSDANHQLNKQQDDPSTLRAFGGVAGLEAYKTAEKAESKERSEDTRILEGILGDSGVFSALEHDSVMESARSESVIVQREATRVAEAAAKALLESRQEAQKAQIGVPTWTGRFGTAGKVGERFKEDSSKPTSRNILTGLYKRSVPDTVKQRGNRGASNSPHVGTPDPNSTTFLARIRSYISDNGGVVKSGALVKTFRPGKTKQEWAECKEMVRQIATFDQSKSEWQLKSEYQDM